MYTFFFRFVTSCTCSGYLLYHWRDPVSPLTLQRQATSSRVSSDRHWGIYLKLSGFQIPAKLSHENTNKAPSHQGAVCDCSRPSPHQLSNCANGPFLEKSTTKPQKHQTLLCLFLEAEVNKTAIIPVSWCIHKEAFSNVFTMMQAHPDCK